MANKMQKMFCFCLFVCFLVVLFEGVWSGCVRGVYVGVGCVWWGLTFRGVVFLCVLCLFPLNRSTC